MDSDPSEQSERGADAATAEPAQRRLRITGLHHVTLICSSIERAVGFYRDLLGMRVVKQTRNQDDRDARHFYFGDEEGRAGTLVSLFEYPDMEAGSVGVGSTHHLALATGSEEELHGWREYLRSRGVPCTEVLDRVYFSSIYMRDPDNHIVEIATAGPGFTVDEPPDELGGQMIEPPRR